MSEDYWDGYHTGRSDKLDELAPAFEILKQRIVALEKVAEKYYELLYEVIDVIPYENRHETALRYLKERESNQGKENQCSAAGYLGEGNE